jgi:uncharacterized repeat protein (TIGR02543 family)
MAFAIVMSSIGVYADTMPAAGDASAVEETEETQGGEPAPEEPTSETVTTEVVTEEVLAEESTAEASATEEEMPTEASATEEEVPTETSAAEETVADGIATEDAVTEEAPAEETAVVLADEAAESGKTKSSIETESVAPLSAETGVVTVDVSKLTSGLMVADYAGADGTAYHQITAQGQTGWITADKSGALDDATVSGSVLIAADSQLVFTGTAGNGISLFINADMTVTMRDLHITSACTFLIYSGKKVTVLLEGDNVLKSSGGSGLDMAGGVDDNHRTELTIDGTGTLTAIATGAGCGIGASKGTNNTINIVGGTILEAKGGTSNGAGIGADSGANLTINISGGTILKAQGSNNSGGAGIGSCNHPSNSQNTTRQVINITGGIIGKAGDAGAGYDPNYGAVGGHCAAGIGLGNYSGAYGYAYHNEINITGGTIYYATCQDAEGAGIGYGGNSWSSLDINIGGDAHIVCAKGNGQSAGIGAGVHGDYVYINISGDAVIDEATSTGKAGIGGGAEGYLMQINISGGTIGKASGAVGIGTTSSRTGMINISGGKVTADVSGTSGTYAIGGLTTNITGGDVTGIGGSQSGIGSNGKTVTISGGATVYGVGPAAGGGNGIGYRNTANVVIKTENGVSPKVSATARNYAAISTGATTQGIAAANLYFAKAGTDPVTSGKSPYGSDLTIVPEGSDENVSTSTVKGAGWYTHLYDNSAYAGQVAAIFDWYNTYYYNTVPPATGFTPYSWSFAQGYMSLEGLFTNAATAEDGVVKWYSARANFSDYYKGTLLEFADYKSLGNPAAVLPALPRATYPEEPEVVREPHTGYTSFAYTGQEGEYVNNVVLPSGQEVTAWTFDNYRQAGLLVGKTKDIALNAENLSKPVPVHIMSSGGETEGIPSTITYDKNIKAGTEAYVITSPETWYAPEEIGSGVYISDPVSGAAGYNASKANPPVRGGYTFDGWTANISGEPGGELTQVGDHQQIYADTTLYAGWTPETYSISYVMPTKAEVISAGYEDEEGNDLSDEEVQKALTQFNRLYSAEDLPTSDLLAADPTHGDPTVKVKGHTFVGWQVRIVDASGDLVPFALTVDGLLPAGTFGDIVLIAKYDTDYFTLTYELNGADTPASLDPARLLWNSPILSKVNYFTPVREGYDFGGWFTTEDFADGTQVDADTRITDDMTIYAKWTEKVVETPAPKEDDPAEEPEEKTEDEELVVTPATVTPTPEEPETVTEQSPAATKAPSMKPASVTAPAAAETPTVPGTTVPVPAPILAVANALNEAAETIADAVTPQAAAEEAEVQPEIIADETAPLSTTDATWPLLNLIFMIFAAGMAVWAALRRRQAAEDDDARAARKRTGLLTAAIAFAAVGIVVWFLTETISGRMVLTDGYTLLQAVLTIGAATGAIFAMKRHDAEAEIETTAAEAAVQ